MKNLIIFLCLFIFSCNSFNQNYGTIKSKGVDKLDIKAMYDSFRIKSTDSDVNTIEMYWFGIIGVDTKFYVSQFCYENFDIGDVIDFEYCKDERFDFGEKEH